MRNFDNVYLAGLSNLIGKRFLFLDSESGLEHEC